jgi:hypothetical protein
MSKHRFAKCRKLGFDVLEERSLLSVSGGSEVGVHESDTVVTPLDTTAASVSTAAGQSLEILGYDGTVDAAGDSTETGTRYRIFDYWGGAWVDAEKDTQAGDDLLCWAGAASNVLAWTGWGQVGGMTTTDQIFQYYQDHFTDAGSLPQFGWNWWFDGTNPAAGWSGWAQVDVSGGNFYPSYSPYEYIHTRGQGDTAEYYSMMDVDQYCRAGYGVALGIFGSIGHAITCWGFNYDSSLSPSDPNYYKGVWVTDSDDSKYTSNGVTAPDNLHYYAVTWDSVSGHYDFNSYCSGAYIGEVDGLTRLTSTVPSTPKPSAPDDFDGDGISDIVWHNQWTGDVGAWLVKNDRAIDWMGLGNASASQWKVAGVGDFDGNRVTDVLWQNQVTGLVGATWRDPTSHSITWTGLGSADPSVWKIAGVGDFNNSGVTGVLWHNQMTGLVGMTWLDPSSCSITWTGLGSADPSVWKVAGVGDFNNSGITGVLWQNQSTGLIGMTRLNPSSHSITWTGLGSADPGAWEVVGAGDFDNNGISDVLWQNRSTGLVGMTSLGQNGQYVYWRGFGTMSAATWTVIGCGDYDGDGTSDVLWHNQTSGEVGAWIVDNGTPTNWKALGTMLPADWKAASDNAPSEPAPDNAAPANLQLLGRGEPHTLLSDALARTASAALNAAEIALLYQNRFSGDFASEFGFTESSVSGGSFDRDAADVSSSTSDLGREVAQSTASVQGGAINPSVLDRIDLSKWMDEGLHRRDDADVFDRLAADRVGGLGDAGFEADWNASVDSCLAG